MWGFSIKSLRWSTGFRTGDGISSFTLQDLPAHEGGAMTLCTSIQTDRSKDFIQIPTDSQAVIAQPVRVCASLHKYADHHLLTSVTCAQTELALICRNHRSQWWTSRLWYSVAGTNQALRWQVLGTGSVWSETLCDSSGLLKVIL